MGLTMPDPNARSALEDRGRKAGVYFTADELLGADSRNPGMPSPASLPRGSPF
jgi:hypothetical protein